MKSQHLVDVLFGFMRRQWVFILCCWALCSLAAILPIDDGKPFPIARFVTVAAESLCLAMLLGAAADAVRRRWFSWLMIALLSVGFIVDGWVALSQGSHFDVRSLQIMLQTNTGEAMEFFGTYLLNLKTLVIAAMLAAVIAGYAMLRRRDLPGAASASPKAKRTAVAAMAAGFCVSLATECTITLLFTSATTQAFTPAQLLANAIAAMDNHSEDIRLLRQANAGARVDSCSFASPEIVLVIGESHSRRHTDLYGYNKPTMPRMTALLRSGNLVAFDSVRTFHTVTYKVLPEMFSTHDPSDSSPWTTSPLFPVLFRRAGYDVALFSNQATRTDMPNLIDFSVYYFINDPMMDSLCFDYRHPRLYPFDGEMVNASASYSPANPHRLTIYHLNGEHVDAENRYPASAARFTPQDYDPQAYNPRQRTDLAHYDNAVSYTDSVLAEIYRLYANRDVVIVYMSDHGELIHDIGDKYGRTNNMTEQERECLRDVPMFVIGTPAYIERHPQMWQSIVGAKSRHWNVSYTSHLLLRLAGINTPYLNQTLSPL